MGRMRLHDTRVMSLDQGMVWVYRCAIVCTGVYRSDKARFLSEKRLPLTKASTERHDERAGQLPAHRLRALFAAHKLVFSHWPAD